MILPVIVIYKISILDSECYKSLLSNYIDTFMVYDNSPETFIQKENDIPNNAIYIRNKKNGGLSIAYNTAAKYAKEHGFDKLLLLDQDTIFSPETIELMEKSKEDVCVPTINLKDNTPFSPSRWRFGLVRGTKCPPGIHSLSDYLLINSGLCVTIKAFEAAGGYNEKIQLDFADFQFMERLTKVAQKFELLDIIAIQNFSNEERDPQKLLSRFSKYLEGAHYFHSENWTINIRIKWLVVLHTISLSKRTKSWKFIKLLLTKKY